MTVEEIGKSLKVLTDGCWEYGEQMALIAEWIHRDFEFRAEKKNNVFSIDDVDRYWYYSGRNLREFVEVTFWVNPVTFERKETTRRQSFFPSEEFGMPDWCKSITEHRRALNAKDY